MLILRLKILIF